MCLEDYVNRSLKNYANKIIIGFAVAPLLFFLNIASAAEPAGSSAAHAIPTVPGMPPVVNPNNLYSETRPDKLSPVVAKHLSRVYVPNRRSNNVEVIDPATF